MVQEQRGGQFLELGVGFTSHGGAPERGEFQVDVLEELFVGVKRRGGAQADASFQVHKKMERRGSSPADPSLRVERVRSVRQGFVSPTIFIHSTRIIPETALAHFCEPAGGGAPSIAPQVERKAAHAEQCSALLFMGIVPYPPNASMNFTSARTSW